MTAPSLEGPSGLLGRLMADGADRIPQRVHGIRSDDPVFGGGPAGSADVAAMRGPRVVSEGHRVRWVDAGTPGPGGFVAGADPRWQRQQPNQRCRSPAAVTDPPAKACAVACSALERAGRPTATAGWRSTDDQAASARVELPDPALRVLAGRRRPFCHSHNKTWKVNGRPDIDEFAESFAPSPALAGESIQLDSLAPSAEAGDAVRAAAASRPPGKLNPRRHPNYAARPQSRRLVARPRRGHLAVIADGTVNDSLARVPRLTRRAVADLAEAGGWEAEYPRDVWRMHRLGFEGGRTLRFDRIATVAGSWPNVGEVRLSTGLGLEAGGGRAVVGISGSRGSWPRSASNTSVRSTAAARTLPGRPASRTPSAQRRSTNIGLLNRFFTAVRQHRWDTALPATHCSSPRTTPDAPTGCHGHWPSRS